jgi:DNA helicase IV
MRLPAYQDLSREQDRINNLPLDKSYLVTGPPGTGKTVMALYRARMLTNKNVPTSLLMHSRLLSQYASNAVKELKIDGIVTTFHSWLWHFYNGHYHRWPPKHGPYDYDWGQIYRHVDQQPPAEGGVQHLIIDEGQDLHKMFYPVARHIARCVTVFADENQRLTPTNSTIEDIRTYGAFHASHELKRNYRNTREIAMLAAQFYTGLKTGIPDPPERRGAKPIVRRFADLNDTVEFIARYERNNPRSQIGVLVPTIRLRRKLYNRLAVKGRTTNAVQEYVGGQGSDADVINFEHAGIVVLCYPSAKGLEFDAVFLPELQDVTADIKTPEFRMQFYVLISRARDALYATYSGEEPKVVAVFPKELVEWQ